MAEIVCNASPLIVLAKSDLLRLLPKLFDAVYVPQAVVTEIEQGPQGDPMRQLLPETPWLRIVQVEPPLSPLAAWQLGPGESEVIEYARLHPGLAVVLDDRAGRRAAQGLGLRLYGTLGVLALAVKRAAIPSFRAAADSLLKAGLRVAPSIVDEMDKELRG